ncbi:FxLD family lanthipeptide [Spirillospora sp. NBC_00431]
MQAERPVEEDEFDLDVRVLVACAPEACGNCPTDDGCGNTCAGNDSTCDSTFDDPS